MKDLIYLFIFFTVLLLTLPIDSKTNNIIIKDFPFYIYKDAKHKINRFVIGGKVGDWNDVNIAENFKQSSKSKETCIRLHYTAKKKSHQGWTSIFWQSSPYNWGFFKNGYNLSKAKRIFFSAWGKHGNEYAEFYIGGVTGKYSDSTIKKSIGTVRLGKERRIYQIDLSDSNLSNIINGFCVTFSSVLNPKGCYVYLDNIYYSDDIIPVELWSLLNSIQKYKKKIKIALFSFKNNSISESSDHLSLTLPNILDVYISKQKNYYMINHKQMNRIFKMIPDNIDQKKKYINNILYNILKVNIFIKGEYEIKDNNSIFLKLSVTDQKKKILMEKNIQGNTVKDLFMKLNTFSVKLIRKINQLK